MSPRIRWTLAASLVPLTALCGSVAAAQTPSLATDPRITVTAPLPQASTQAMGAALTAVHYAVWVVFVPNGPAESMVNVVGFTPPSNGTQPALSMPGAGLAGNAALSGTVPNSDPSAFMIVVPATQAAFVQSWWQSITMGQMRAANVTVSVFNASNALLFRCQYRNASPYSVSMATTVTQLSVPVVLARFRFATAQCG